MNPVAVHPIRRALPVPVLARIIPEAPPGRDVRLFLTTFVTAFVAISGLIA